MTFRELLRASVEFDPEDHFDALQPYLDDPPKLEAQMATGWQETEVRNICAWLNEVAASGDYPPHTVRRAMECVEIASEYLQELAEGGEDLVE